MRKGCSWMAVLPTLINRRAPRLLLGTLLAALLTGCAALIPEQPQDDAPKPLSTEAFDRRIDELALSLESQCDTSTLLDNQQRQAQRMTADVREIGSLLRRLNDNVDDLALAAPQTIASGAQQVSVGEACSQENSPSGNKTLVGRSEWIGLPHLGTYLKARIDSGANTASLSAREITPFERDGEGWVRFKLALNDDDVVVESVRDKWFEAPVERRVKVLQATGEDSRPVISLLITLGPIRQHAEFTLNDRTHLNFPVLLGRRFLLDIALIDVAESYLHERPEFSGGAPSEQALNDQSPDTDMSDE